MNYEQALEYIHSRPRMKNTDNHKAMRRLLDSVGNPQDSLKYIHIAGTNGKGSCAGMCAKVLELAGYKVGLNISPFVIDFTERFSVNGEYIPRQTLAQITSALKEQCDRLEKEQGLTVLEFELVTAIAFCYFAMEKCDVVCLEVGIGGLMDSTNVIKDCLVSCIMNISYDHTEILGDTLEKIARQKAGIIKPGRPVVCYPAMDKGALRTVKEIARRKNSHVVLPDMKSINHRGTGLLSTVLEYKDFTINQAFAGVHQSYNACVVIETMLLLKDMGYSISHEDIAKGIETTKFPARIEKISENPLVILDGGHNRDGVSALINVLKENNLKNLTAVWASLSDKQPEKIIQMMAPYVSALYTVNLHGPRALDSEVLADMAKGHIKNVYAAGDLSRAIRQAAENIDGGLLVFGSLYLAADARQILIDRFSENK